eukprot:GHVQ01024151.1.p1 GENE.GHVQ01024151.1~~GHVQ01024151.1.p1  ORF type:complete len:383 (+),score=39.94 GHVQ01024151.1:167-1315(+)
MSSLFFSSAFPQVASADWTHPLGTSLAQPLTRSSPPAASGTATPSAASNFLSTTFLPLFFSSEASVDANSYPLQLSATTAIASAGFAKCGRADLELTRSTDAVTGFQEANASAEASFLTQRETSGSKAYAVEDEEDLELPELNLAVLSPNTWSSFVSPCSLVSGPSSVDSVKSAHLPLLPTTDLTLPPVNRSFRSNTFSAPLTTCVALSSSLTPDTVKDPPPPPGFSPRPPLLETRNVSLIDHVRASGATESASCQIGRRASVAIDSSDHDVFVCPNCLVTYPVCDMLGFSKHIAQRGHDVKQITSLRRGQQFHCQKCSRKFSDVYDLLKHWQEGPGMYHGTKVLKKIRRNVYGGGGGQVAAAAAQAAVALERDRRRSTGLL